MEERDLSPREWSRVAGISEKDFGLVVDNLVRMNLLQVIRRPGTGVAIEPVVVSMGLRDPSYLLTSLATRFVEACRGPQPKEE